MVTSQLRIKLSGPGYLHSCSLGTSNEIIIMTCSKWSFKSYFPTGKSWNNFKSVVLELNTYLSCIKLATVVLDFKIWGADHTFIMVMNMQVRFCCRYSCRK